MSSLKARVRAFIEAHGPIGLDQFMSLALGASDGGYYRTRQPIGAGGDFTTAPEISQIFGEMIGIALADAYLRLASPSSFTLAELGPGRGTLMRDLCRAIRHVPGMEAARRLVLVETSLRLRSEQAALLADLEPVWVDAIERIAGDGPLLLVANEFLDALPVRQFVRTEAGWREQLVDLAQEDGLCLRPSPSPLPATLSLPPHAARLGEGAVIEVSPARETLVQELTAMLRARGGIALLIDYGASELTGDSFQAVRAHAKADPLDDPGESDLSSHVDFSSVAAAVAREQGCLFGPVPQGTWLARMGADQRLERLLAQAQGAQHDALKSGHERLTAADAMGTLFKVVAITGDPAFVPAGFTAEERQ